MRSINFLPEQNLRVLYGDNRILPDVSDDVFNDWCGTLPERFQREWRGVPEIRHRASSSSAPDSFQFAYDDTRFSLFRIRENYKAALSILDECYTLKDAIKDIDAKLLAQADDIKLAEIVRGIEADREPLIARASGSIGAASKLKMVDDGDSQVVTVGDEIPMVPDGGDTQIPLEYKLWKRRMAVSTEQLEKKIAEFKDYDHPNNLHVVASRLKSKYSHRFAELIMYIEVIKQGLYVIHDVRPSRLDIGLKPEQLDRAIEDYLEAAPSIADFPEYMRVNQASFLAEEDVPPIEHETIVRDYLWEVAQRLQRSELDTDDRVVMLSLRELKDFNTSHTVEHDDTFREILKTGGEFKKDKSITFNLGDSFAPFRLLGLTIEIVLDDVKQAKKIGSGPAYEQYHKHKGYLRKPIQYSVVAPPQRLGPDDTYKYRHIKPVRFSTAPVFRDIEPTMNTSSSPLFFGTNKLNNISPVGGWTLNVALSDSAMFAATVDINVYLHLVEF